MAGPERDDAGKRQVMEWLQKTPDGCTAPELAAWIGITERWARHLLRDLVAEGRVVRRRAVGHGPGSPGYRYYRKEPELLLAHYKLAGTREVWVVDRDITETETLLPEEQARHRRAGEALSVLQRIATQHIGMERYTQDVLAVAPAIAVEDPTALVIGLAQWTVDRLNRAGDALTQLVRQHDGTRTEREASILESRLQSKGAEAHGRGTGRDGPL